MAQSCAEDSGHRHEEQCQELLCAVKLCLAMLQHSVQPTAASNFPLQRTHGCMLGGGGQQRTVPAGQRSWSISVKQGKLISGPSMLDNG